MLVHRIVSKSGKVEDIVLPDASLLDQFEAYLNKPHSNWVGKVRGNDGRQLVIDLREVMSINTYPPASA